MFGNFKNTLGRTLVNIKGWKTNRKIVVIESDDWGSIRMPNMYVYDQLLKKGIRVDLSLYDTWDSLEKREDVEALFTILDKKKNNNGESAKITFNSVMGNPDFIKIKDSGFEQYYYKLFWKSYQEYYGQDLKNIWEEAIQSKIMKPQFHAREHLNVSLWMKDLKLGNNQTKTAFELGFFGLKTQTSSPFQKHYLSAYRAETNDELKAINRILSEGLNLFSASFGFDSSSFIAANYVWPKELEQTLKKCGVAFIQSQRAQIAPLVDKNKTNIHRHYLGERNKLGQLYLLRNVHFEPYLNQNKDWVNRTLKQIETSFFWKNPAVISSHRVNYVSNMSVKHRDSSLKKLDLLLNTILRKWPDAVFLSSDELGELIFNEKYAGDTQQ